MSAQAAVSPSLRRALSATPAAPDEADRTSRIIMLDPAVVGQSHLLVNAGFIRLLLSRFDEIIVIAEETHREALENYLRDEMSLDRIQFISYVDRKQMLSLLRREIARINAGAVLLTNLHYALFATLNMMRLPRDVALYWVLHSHLSSLAHPGLRERIKNRLKVFLLFDLFPASRFIVCGQSIRDGFLKRPGGQRYRHKIAAVFHPVGLSDVVAGHPAVRATRAASAIPSFIYIQGWHQPPPDVRSALERLARITQARTMRLDIVWNSFSRSQNRKHFTRDYRDRIRAIAESDFFLFLPSDDYSLQASGALLDLVVAATPALGIKTAFGSELEQIIGEFGFFFDTLDELVAFVQTVDRDLLFRRRTEFQRNLKRGMAVIAQLNAAQLSQLGPVFNAHGVDDAAARRLRDGAALK